MSHSVSRCLSAYKDTVKHNVVNVCLHFQMVKLLLKCCKKTLALLHKYYRPKADSLLTIQAIDKWKQIEKKTLSTPIQLFSCIRILNKNVWYFRLLVFFLSFCDLLLHLIIKSSVTLMQKNIFPSKLLVAFECFFPVNDTSKESVN